MLLDNLCILLIGRFYEKSFLVNSFYYNTPHYMQNIDFVQCEKGWILYILIENHIKIEDIQANNYTLDELIQHGEHVFAAILNTLDGKGRPASTGGGAKREPRIFPDNLNRISGPDSDSCAGCHNRPSVGGGGDNAANVFVLAQFEQFVDFSKQEHVVKGLEGIGNERNTLGMFGSGFIELLAREMTDDLQLQKIDPCYLHELKHAHRFFYLGLLFSYV